MVFGGAPAVGHVQLLNGQRTQLLGQHWHCFVIKEMIVRWASYCDIITPSLHFERLRI